MEEHKHTNQLIHESSPYLLQHAHNPVNWHPWNAETLEKAKKEDKILLVSIGYSACHWCHVMEHESFEDEEVAKVMNDHFICVKVDREERPDVDQVYMDAVQTISGRGGWPLNCFALPDGKPFWGGTYFQRDQWIGILTNVVNLFASQRKKLQQQAADIFDGISGNSFVQPEIEKNELVTMEADEMAYIMGNKVDREDGGFKGAPKFPMPNNFLFLLRYNFYSENPEARELVELTLQKMAAGGIYDQIGGGFARYSVDDRWHVPHFEKMLYDNAQLVSLYSEAYQLTKNPLYAEVIQDTLDFIARELTSEEGGFYSALDADSEGVEGKYYVWTEDEFNQVCGKDSQILAPLFGIGGDAYWEDENHVLIKAMSETDLSIKNQMDLTEVIKRVQDGKKKLLKHRSARVMPGLDDKILTSWNGLMLKGCIDAYRALGKKTHLEMAIRNANFLADKMMSPSGLLRRTYKNGKTAIDGFLEDYSNLMEAFISLYEVTFDEKWIERSVLLADYTIEHFYDQDSGMFYFTSDLHNDTIVRKIEVVDNVTPSSTSSLARSLQILGFLNDNKDYNNMARSMLDRVRDKLQKFPTAFSNWGILYLNHVYPVHTAVITGPDADKFRDQLMIDYRPNTIFAGGVQEGHLPITRERWDKSKTRVYVCTDQTCQLPVQSVEEALPYLKKK